MFFFNEQTFVIKFFNFWKKQSLSFRCFVILIAIKKLFWKSMFSITSTIKCFFNTTTKKFFISWFFFNKNIMSIECNYEIYDKKLLIIIRCLKHWRFELKFINISMKIFNDYKILKVFITSKNFTRRQTRWIKIFFEYNFKIMY